MSWESKEINWDILWLTQAFVISQKSPDPRTVHGAYLVSKNNSLLSHGYNGPVKNSDDNELKQFLKDEMKYYLLLHAEENCLLNYHGTRKDLEGSTIYVTGEPCHKCLKAILQKGIRKIVIGHVSSKCVDEKDKKAKEILLNSLNDAVEIVEYNNMDEVKALLNQTLDYIKYKEE